MADGQRNPGPRQPTEGRGRDRMERLADELPDLPADFFDGLFHLPPTMDGHTPPPFSVDLGPPIETVVLPGSPPPSSDGGRTPPIVPRRGAGRMVWNIRDIDGRLLDIDEFQDLGLVHDDGEEDWLHDWKAPADGQESE